MLIYEKLKNSYYKNKQKIDEAEIQLQLPSYAYNKLQETGICKIKESTVDKYYKQAKKQYDKKRRIVDKNKHRDSMLLSKYKNLYKIGKELYKGEYKLALSRKNTHYGYYNFITYLDTDDIESIDNIILTDIKKQLNSNNKKTTNKSILDDI